MKKELLAFIHIKKAAGTTFVHILRLNFFMKHCDIDYIKKKEDSLFQTKDMQKILIINPMLKSIAGHKVKPFSDLIKNYPGIRFVTILRDPIRRYISNYQYNVEKLGHDLSFEQYLETDSSYNKQVRTIAGSDNIEQAKEIISKKIFMVGIVEEFDEFLILLKKKLQETNFKPNYKLQNSSKPNSPLRKNIDKNIHYYRSRIIERNLLDIELYNFVKNEVLPKEKERYGTHFEKDVNEFKKLEKKYTDHLFRFIDFSVRKFYYTPIMKILAES